jgi:hypothetical protein
VGLIRADLADDTQGLVADLPDGPRGVTLTGLPFIG